MSDDLSFWQAVIEYPIAVWDDIVLLWVISSHSWWAGWFIVICLALPGVIVVARNQIFIGAAVAQASAAGVAAGFWFAGMAAGLGVPVDPCREHNSGLLALVLPYASAVTAAILAAIACTPGRRGSPESRTGWIFLVGAALSVLLLAKSAHGTREIERIVTSSGLLGATIADVVVLAICAALSAAFAACGLRRLILLIIDPSWAPLADMPRRRWDLAIAVWIGLACALAIRNSGLLFTFACLVLPALAARSCCREVWLQFIVAPILGLIGVSAGFALATHHDLPNAQVAVVTLAALPILVQPLRWLRRNA